MTDRAEPAARYYLDTNTIIYLVERVDPFVDAVERVLAHVVGIGGVLVTSEIAVAECLYGIYASKRPQLRSVYMTFFDSDMIEVLPIGTEVLLSAAHVGGTRGLKLVDAIHMASAEAGGCMVFLTNDRRIRSLRGGRVLQLSDLAP